MSSILTPITPEELKEELAKLFPDTLFAVIRQGQDTGWIPKGYFGVVIKPKRIAGNGKSPLNVAGKNFNEILIKAQQKAQQLVAANG